MKQVQTITDVNLKGKQVLVRVDYNVPMKDGKITDNTRIVATLPTINYLLSQSAKVVLMSHLGRPKGQKNLKYSLRPVAQELSRLLKRPVLFLEDAIGSDVEETIRDLDEGSVVLLENLRFYPEEEANDPEFSKQLAHYGDIYVNDAFGTAHRAHASTAGVPALLPIKVAGFLIQKELEFLGTKTAQPERPFTVILGGAKVSDKIGVIDTLLEKCNSMLIGGAMAYTFLKAQGKNVGKSLVEEDKLEAARAALGKAEKLGVQLLLPVDHVITDCLDFEAGTVGEIKVVEDILEDWMGIDIGPKTVEQYSSVIQSAKTVLWNGPMGVFEIDAASKGTFAIAKGVAESSAISIVGGGDSIQAIAKSGYADKITFMSTGGGASLEFLEGKDLPGISALNSKNV